MVKEKVIEGTIHTIVDVVGEVILEGLDRVSNGLTNNTRHSSFSSSSQDEWDIKSVAFGHFGSIATLCSTSATNSRGVIVKDVCASNDNSGLHTLDSVCHFDGIFGIGTGFFLGNDVKSLSKDVLKDNDAPAVR
jgi:hypothetical protein